MSTPEIFTGSTRFLQANRFMIASMLDASAHCELHASEDILDASGVKLWARGRPVDAHLMERLAGRRLKKPIEVCIYAADPIARADVVKTLEVLIAESPGFHALVGPSFKEIVEALKSAVPNPTELLLLSVQRYGTRQIHSHAVAVAAVALSLAVKAGESRSALVNLARAGMLHDVGELYLDPSLLATRRDLSSDELRRLVTHPLTGAQAARELARVEPSVCKAIEQSHERLDGTGYPSRSNAEAIGLSARALLTAEAITSTLLKSASGLARAAVAIRILPGEFPLQFTNAVNAIRTAVRIDAAEDTVNGSGEVEVGKCRDVILSALSLAENQADRHEAVNAARLEAARVLSSLHWVLRSIGVEGELGVGSHIVPEGPLEAIEISAIVGELRYRLVALRRYQQLLAAGDPRLADSAFSDKLLHILSAL